MVWAAEEVVEAEALLLDRPPQHLAAQHETRRQARPLLVEAGLEQELAAGEHERVVGGDRAAAELEQMEPQPAPLGRGVGERAVEALGPRVAQDRRALARLPARRLHLEHGVEV